jgi:type III secretory pathway component EscU
VNAHRKQERKKLAESAGMTGPNAANLFVVGKGVIVGIAYKPDVSGIPFVAAKGEGKTVREYLARAREKKVFVLDNAELAALLMAKSQAGQPIPKESFGGVANALVQAGFS